jgi:hypothetical protein
VVVVAGALDDELKAWTNSGSREGMAPSPLVGRCQAFTALLRLPSSQDEDQRP